MVSRFFTTGLVLHETNCRRINFYPNGISDGLHFASILINAKYLFGKFEMKYVNACFLGRQLQERVSAKLM